MERREFAWKALAGCTASAIALPLLADESKEGGPSQAEPIAFKFDIPVPIHLRSSGVRWRGGEVQLVHFEQITFALANDQPRLQAKLDGYIFTFDSVDYEISGAVFGEKGELLGAARTVCPVPRIWAGRYGKQSRSLTLDFGISNNYPTAKSFLACISDREVLTPDQWQNG